VAITIYTLLVGADAAVFWTAIMGGLTLGEVALLSSVTKPKVVFFAKIVYMLKYDIINKPNQWQSVTSVSRIRFQGETHE